MGQLEVRRSAGYSAAALWVVALASLGGFACTSADDGAPADCASRFDAILAEEGLIPAPAAPGLPAPLVYAPALTVPGAVLRVIDPNPTLRGEHPATLFDLAPDCVPRGRTLPFAPPAAPDDPPARGQVGDTDAPHAAVAGLLVTGSEPGAAEDRLTWSDALADIGVAAVHLHAPSADQALDGIGEMCERLPAGGTALLVNTGRASAAGGGALVLGAQALRYSRMAEALEDGCRHAALLVWVIDAAWAGGIETQRFTIPTLLWRASSLQRPNAPRLHPGGGGALSAALAERIRETARETCLDAIRPDAAELGRLLAPSGVRERLLEMRWQSLGAPAVEGVANGQQEALRQQVAAALQHQVPTALLSRTPDPLGLRGQRCETLADCDAFAPGCPLRPCRRYRCDGGQCVPEVAVGEGCDDGDPCTEDDRCRGDARCAGSPVDCSDGDPCTLDGCDPVLGCLNVGGAEAPCDDGDACTSDDRCDDDGACVGIPLDCDDGDPCTLDGCSQLDGCISNQAQLPCDDGDPCTLSDVCRQGRCQGTALRCSDGNPCTRDVCDPDSGACYHPPFDDGAPCDDGDPCTTADRCQQSGCVGQLKVCDDGLECTFDSCEAGLCTHVAEPGSCIADGGCIPVGAHPESASCLVCVATDTLVPDPTLEGAPCEDDAVACTSDVCNGGVCTHQNLPGTCTRPDGSCVQVGEDISQCLVCGATGTGVAKSAGTACDSGHACADATCDGGGFCRSIPLACCPSPEIACGEGVGGTRDQGAGLVDTWSCTSDHDASGPEHSYRLQASCDGTLDIALTGPEGVVLIATRGEPDACATGACDAAASASLSLGVSAGDVIVLTVDGGHESGGDFSLDLDCQCAPTDP